MSNTNLCRSGPLTVDPVGAGKSIEYTGVQLSVGTTPELYQLYRFSGFRYPETRPTNPPTSDYKVLLGSRHGRQARARIHHSEEAVAVEDGHAVAIGVAPIIFARRVVLASESSTLAIETGESDVLYFIKGASPQSVARASVEGSSAPPVVLNPGQYVIVTNPTTNPVISQPHPIPGDEMAAEFIAYLTRRANAAGLPLDHEGGWGSGGGSSLLEGKSGGATALASGTGGVAVKP